MPNGWPPTGMVGTTEDNMAFAVWHSCRGSLSLSSMLLQFILLLWLVGPRAQPSLPRDHPGRIPLPRVLRWGALKGWTVGKVDKNTVPVRLPHTGYQERHDSVVCYLACTVHDSKHVPNDPGPALFWSPVEGCLESFAAAHLNKGMVMVPICALVILWPSWISLSFQCKSPAFHILKLLMLDNQD